MTAYTIGIAIAFLTLCFLIIVAPSFTLTLFSPLSQRSRDLASYYRQEKMVTFFRALAKMFQHANIDYFKINFDPVRDYFGIRRLRIFLFDKERKMLYVKHSVGHAERGIRSELIPFTDVNNPIVRGYVYGKTISVEEHRMYYVPLARKNHILGVLEVERKHERMFTESEKDILAYLAFYLYLLEASALIEDALRELRTGREEAQKEYMERLKEHEAGFIRTARLSLLGEMARGLAHEIKNPLTTIKLLLSPAERLDEHDVRIVREEIGRLDRLLGQFLSFARGRTYHFVEMNLNLVLNNMLYLFEKRCKQEGVTLNTKCDSSLPNIKGDEDALKQVILNILENAVDAVPNGGGVIEVETKTVMYEGKVHVDLTIRDNGEGISPDRIDNVFNPFFTTKKKGSGLGLSISYNIVIDHGGVVSASNHFQGGAQFRMLFPLYGETERDVVNLTEQEIPSALAFLETIPEVQVTEENLRRYLLNQDMYIVKVLKDKDRIVGFISMYVLPPEAEVLDLAVHPDARHRGLGKRLIEMGTRMVEKRGVNVIFLEVAETNTPALLFYEHLDFRRQGVRKNYYPGGISAIVMERRFPSSS